MITGLYSDSTKSKGWSFGLVSVVQHITYDIWFCGIL